MFRFLELAEVEELHLDSLLAYGGSQGVRDLGLVESAIGSAIHTALYGGGDAYDVAAAYAFHIAEAQAVIDGNKRTAIAAPLVFLRLNARTIIKPSQHEQDALYGAMIAIANHELDKAGFAALLRTLLG